MDPIVFSLQKIKHFLVLIFFFLVTGIATAQCDQAYDWAVWDGFTGSEATGLINTGGGTISVTMTANYSFSSTSNIFGYYEFDNFNGPLPPNTTTPQTTWAVGANGETTMCFSQTVSNPVLMFASLGSAGQPVTLSFSYTYSTIFEGSGMLYPNPQTIIGEEGYTILVFPGQHDCITIYSTTPEYYTNITWGLNPPLFDVVITEIASDCASATFMASGGSTYEWSGGTDPGEATNTFTESGEYVLTVTDDLGCTVVTSVAVEIDGTSSNSTTTIAACGSYTWNGQTYAQSGTYTYSTQTPTGCDSTATLELTISSIVTANESATACGSYEWNGQTYTESGSYTYQTTTTSGCDSTITLALTILEQSGSAETITTCDSYSAADGSVFTTSGIHQIIMTAQNGCDSVITIDLTVNASDLTDEFRYTCDPLDTDTTITYYTNTAGCDSIHRIIPIQYGPSDRALAAFSITPFDGPEDDGAITVVNTSSNASTYLWSFGDGTASSTEEAPAHTYEEPGNYTITLIVTNDLGCIDTATQVIRYALDPLVYVPNSFTPNGDGINDQFAPLYHYGADLSDLQLTVYDRWGKPVCTLNDITEGWNGEQEGHQAPIGVYNWLLRYRSDQGTEECFGMVTLVR